MKPGNLVSFMDSGVRFVLIRRDSATMVRKRGIIQRVCGRGLMNKKINKHVLYQYFWAIRECIYTIENASEKSIDDSWIFYFYVII